jgi:hypothetical protein
VGESRLLLYLFRPNITLLDQCRKNGKIKRETDYSAAETSPDRQTGSGREGDSQRYIDSQRQMDREGERRPVYRSDESRQTDKSVETARRQ